MTQKLTLHLKEETVQKVKRISEKQRKNISELVEDSLNSIPDESEVQETAIEKIRKIMAPHIGKLNLPENIEYKEMIAE